MPASLNRVTLIGNVGRDPEIRSTNSGSEIASFSIATSESWKDRNSGEKKERTEWHNIVVFNEPLVNIVRQYVHKGSKVFVEGQMQTRKWTGNDGVERYSTEVMLPAYRGQIILLDGSRSERAPAPSAEDYGTSRATAAREQPERPTNDLDDEIPF